MAQTMSVLAIDIAKLVSHVVVRLPRRRVVGRSFAWAACFRRLARDYQRLPAPLAGFHVLAFVIRLLKRFVEMIVQSVSHALERGRGKHRGFCHTMHGVSSN